MKIGIVGLGLIGGSLGLDLSSQGLTVVGVSRQETTCKIAVDRGVVAEASLNYDILTDVDLIFICTPIALITSTVQAIIPYLHADTIITDVGSVKQPIVDQISPLWHNFIGGHPMAGTAEQGINAAQLGLFQGAPYVFTPIDTTNQEIVTKVSAIAQSLGSRVYICSPEAHDQAVAWISHAPVFISAGLIAACSGENNPEVRELARKLASSGFRDTSRVGGGNPELGLMMAQYNQQALLRSLHHYRDTLNLLIDHIEHNNWDHLSKTLAETQRDRPNFLS